MSHIERICHDFMYADKSKAYQYASYNVSYRNHRLFSYRSVLAVRDESLRSIRIDTDIGNYSTSSNRHWRYLRSSIPPGIEVFEYSFKEGAINYYLREIEDLLAKSARATKSDYMPHIKRTATKAYKYIVKYKADKRTAAVKQLLKYYKYRDNLEVLKVVAKELSVQEKIVAKERKAREATKEAERAIKEAERAATQLQRFSPGRVYDKNHKGVYLKTVGDTLVTSNSIKVSLKDALMLYKRYKKNNDIVGARLDRYTVMKSDEDEVKIGCTTISSKEMDLVLGNL